MGNKKLIEAFTRYVSNTMAEKDKIDPDEALDFVNSASGSPATEKEICEWCEDENRKHGREWIDVETLEIHPPTNGN